MQEGLVAHKLVTMTCKQQADVTPGNLGISTSQGLYGHPHSNSLQHGHAVKTASLLCTNHVDKWPDTQVPTSTICLTIQLQMGNCLHKITAASTPAACASMRSRRAGADRECRACLQCCLNPSSSTNRVTYPVRNLYNSTGTIDHMYHRTLHSADSACLSFQGQHKATPMSSSALPKLETCQKQISEVSSRQAILSALECSTS